MMQEFSVSFLPYVSKPSTVGRYVYLHMYPQPGKWMLERRMYVCMCGEDQNSKIPFLLFICKESRVQIFLFLFLFYLPYQYSWSEDFFDFTLFNLYIVLLKATVRDKYHTPYHNYRNFKWNVGLQ